MKLEELKERAKKNGLEFDSHVTDIRKVALYDFQLAFFHKEGLEVAHDKYGRAFSRIKIEGKVTTITAFPQGETPYLAVNPYYRNPQLDLED